MFFSSPMVKGEVEQIIRIINQYNAQSQLNPIKTLHPGTSRYLDFIGKIAHVRHSRESTLLYIPPAIIPDHLLRKKYGICFLLRDGLEETFKSIREAIKLKGLISTDVDPEAVKFCYQVTQEMHTPLEEVELYRLIIDTIVQMQKNNYIRSLKLLVFLTSNLKLLNLDVEKDKFLIELLKREQKILERLYPHHDIKKFFNRYLPRIEAILKSYKSDDHLLENLTNHYPIIFCSTEDADVSSRIHYHKEEIDFDHIKIVFTTTTHVERLKNHLSSLGLLETIKVYGFEHFIENIENNLQDIDEMRMYIERSNTLQAIMDAIAKYPHLLTENELLAKKISRCLLAYLAKKDKEQLEIAKWILKNVPQGTLIDMMATLKQYINFNLQSYLHIKSDIDQSYISRLHLIDPNYFAKQRALTYLKHLTELRQKIKNLAAFMDYEKNQTPLQLHALLEPKPSLFKERDRYLWEYLTRLQTVYMLLKEDQRQGHEPFQENIDARLMFVKNKYVELLHEYQQQHLIDVLMMSDLGKALAINLNRSRWSKLVKWFNHKKKY